MVAEPSRRRTLGDSLTGYCNGGYSSREDERSDLLIAALERQISTTRVPAHPALAGSEDLGADPSERFLFAPASAVV